MKLLFLVLAGLVLMSVMSIGCEPTAHSRYRDMTYRRVNDTDVLGIQDDTDALIFMSERPSHLSQWFNN
jgi:hypothetical protein